MGSGMIGCSTPTEKGRRAHNLWRQVMPDSPIVPRRCADCPTDISDRGSSATRCDSCQRRRRNDRRRARRLATRSRVCRDCRANIAGRGRRAVRCVKCAREYKRRALAAWRERNRDRVKAERPAKDRARYADVPAYRRRCIDRAIQRRKQAGQGIGRRSLRKRLADRDGRLCAWCGESLDPFDSTATHVDHILPVALGGTGAIDNLRLLHAECNRAKGDQDPGEARASR